MKAAALSPSDRILKGLHGLRGLAAFGIVLFHLQAIPSLHLPGPFDGAIGHLYLAVHLFFVLSAFSLAHAAASPRNTGGSI